MPKTIKTDTRTDQQRQEDELANAIGLRALSAITSAVPPRLTRRDLLFIVERLLMLCDEGRAAVIAHNRGLQRAHSAESFRQCLLRYARTARKSELGQLLIEVVILHFAALQNETGTAFRDAVLFYKVDVAAIAQEVKAEFAANGNLVVRARAA